MATVQHIVASNINVLERIGKDNGDIPALAESIKKEGLHNPIHVIENNRGQYVLLAGEKRLKAVILLGEPLIAVKVINAKVKPENFYSFHRQYQIKVKMIERERNRNNQPRCGHMLIK